jgi:hypothetical protein
VPFPVIFSAIGGKIMLAVKEWEIKKYMVEGYSELVRFAKVDVGISFSFEARYCSGDDFIPFPPAMQCE